MPKVKYIGQLYEFVAFYEDLKEQGISNAEIVRRCNNRPSLDTLSKFIGMVKVDELLCKSRATVDYQGNWANN